MLLNFDPYISCTNQVLLYKNYEQNRMLKFLDQVINIKKLNVNENSLVMELDSSFVDDFVKWSSDV